MNRIKIFGLLAITALFVFACSKKGSTVDNFDHEAQIPVDKDLLTAYFNTHYYNTSNESIGTIGELVADVPEALPVEDQIALNSTSSPVDLKEIKDIEANDTDTNYSMYYIKLNDGGDFRGKGGPTQLDSVYVNYKGMLLDGTVFDSNVGVPTWFSLTGVVQGWALGFYNFAGGNLVQKSDGDFYFEDFGKGFLFIPSGLGYRNNTSGSIKENSPLVFEIELHDVNLVDHDLDTVPTKLELTVADNGSFTFYDTDGDGFNDYVDKDDDGDGKLTKDEIKAGTDYKDASK